jgi:hypothetical protein
MRGITPHLPAQGMSYYTFQVNGNIFRLKRQDFSRNQNTFGTALAVVQ